MNFIEGLDCSSFQGDHINWEEVAGSGIEFAICRAGGAKWKDHTFGSNFARSIAAGLLTGAYYVFYPDVDAWLQAEYFFDVASSTQMPPALDLEVKGEMSPAGYAEAFQECLERCEELFGRKPMIYGSPSFLGQMLAHMGQFKDYDLWIAHYGTQKPLIPQPWSEWRMWQYIGNLGKVQGIGPPCDRDRFNGTLEDLKAWAAGNQGPTLLPDTP